MEGDAQSSTAGEGSADACTSDVYGKKAPIAPKGYKLVEARATKWGYIYYKYVREPEKPKRRKKRE